MNITITDLIATEVDQYDFVKAGFEIGQAAGDFPAYRNGPTGEEMVALATDGEDLLGFATFYHAGEPERVWLDLLWVAPPHRHKSAGTRLLAAVVAYSERHGLALEFGTLSSNKAMQGLATSFGLEPYVLSYRKEPIAA